jgi:hypothetical protein
MTAAMSRSRSTFPFGDDVYDGPAIAHLRNYSNYLLPRNRGIVRNTAEAIAVILRGILSNVVIVLATLLVCALLTLLVYPNKASLSGSYILRLLNRPVAWLPETVLSFPFLATLGLTVVLVLLMLFWALARSRHASASWADDASGPVLFGARILIVAIATMAFLDFQPIAIRGVAIVSTSLTSSPLALVDVSAFFATLSGVVSFLGSSLGFFLKKTENAQDTTTLVLRGLTHILIVLAALVVPLLLWIAYLCLSAWAIGDVLPNPSWLDKQYAWIVYLTVLLPLLPIAVLLTPNAYSLHRLYRDRLSRAFLFDPSRIQENGEPAPLDGVKLSELPDDVGPYHLINAALNVQGSAEANRRGRNADFFIFTRDFAGSDLTRYAPLREAKDSLRGMEAVDQQLDLATAMAISGAAVSANMGGSTTRLLSPTLALLNIRLGYWLRNPLDLNRSRGSGRPFAERIPSFLSKFYLLAEMLNLLKETSRNLYLTDGGHIENLGAYELLKRGCQLIMIVDAEADPSMSFPSLLKLERYARIDLGVRITLPWEAIAQMTKSASRSLGPAGDGSVCKRGPHCAVGRITYVNGTAGVILYFKSSLSGDEKDYILDYKKRYLKFPHETTGDQFFSEEQFEAYRGLGFHVVDRFFDGVDDFAWADADQGGWARRDEAFSAARALMSEPLGRGERAKDGH